MSRHSIAIGAALAVASLGLAAPAFAHPAAATPLAGTVGPGFTITLDKGGKKVSSLKPGSYAITVSDKASVHDFHLIGPGVNKVITTVPFVGKKSVTVLLKKGTYTYQCDPHAQSGMKATFKVA
jgi:plastocyanin